MPPMSMETKIQVINERRTHPYMNAATTTAQRLPRNTKSESGWLRETIANRTAIPPRISVTTSQNSCEELSRLPGMVETRYHESRKQLLFCIIRSTSVCLELLSRFPESALA